MKNRDRAGAVGRPRQFCEEEALAAALRVFWSKGYEGTSMTDLTEAMGIARPSLYAAFGNKEELFRKVLDLYEREKLQYLRGALEAPTARAVVERLLRGALDSQTNSCEPRGCLGVISSVACGPEAEAVRADVLNRGATARQAIVDRFQRAKDEGDLPGHVDVEGLTRLVSALLQGMAVQAGAGASREELEGLIEAGLAFWPVD
jgi:AcrR family transcriptional regulator